MNLKTTCVSLVLCVLWGCSTVIVEPYDAGRYKQGIRFYRPQPYVLISQAVDEKGAPTGGNTLQIIYLPDRSQEYVMRVEPGLGTVSMKPTLADGWNLTGLEASVDNTKLTEIVTGILGLGKASGAASVQPGKDVGVKPGLYRLVLPDSPHTNAKLVGPITISDQ